jgi:hypothetical protein
MIEDYIKRKWLFLLIVPLFLVLNIWVWSSVFYQPAEEIKPSGEFVETKKMVLMK